MGNSLHTDVTSTAFLFKEILKMRRRQMSPGTRKRTQSPAINVQWLYPIAQEKAYQKYLFELMDVYSDISIPVLRNNGQRWVEEQRTDDIRADDFNEEFQQLITKLQQTQTDMFDEKGKGVEGFNAGSIITRLSVLGFAVSQFNGKQWEKMTKRILGQPFMPMEPWLQETVNQWSQMNFGLIKSLTDEYIKKTNFIVRDGVLDGRPWDVIMKDIRRMDKNMTRSRARLLARDQVGKLNGQLTKRRNKEAGIDMYKWLTARDERVRSSHKPLHNKICRWDNNSVYADSVSEASAGNWKARSSIGGYVGIPGQDVQCRCTGVPVYTDLIQEVDKEIRQELRELEGAPTPAAVPGKPVRKKPKKLIEPKVPVFDTIPEATKWANDNKLTKVPLDYTGLDNVTVANELNRSLSKVKSRGIRYGEVIIENETRLLASGERNPKYSILANLTKVNRRILKKTGRVDIGYQNLAVNNKYFGKVGSVKDINKAILESNKTGWWVPKNFDGLVNHEVGHYLTAKKLAEQQSIILGTIREKELSRALTERFGTFPKGGMSKYGTTSISEFMAETYTKKLQGEIVDPNWIKLFNEFSEKKL